MEGNNSRTMNIIISDIKNVVLYENNHKALCALCCENQQPEDIQPIEYSSKKLKSLFEAYVVFDKLTDSVIDSYNVEIEDFKTIAYVRLCNMKDTNGDNIELCHYFPETSTQGEETGDTGNEILPRVQIPLWKKLIMEKKFISIIGIVIITSLLILLNLDKIDKLIHSLSDNQTSVEIIDKDSTKVDVISSMDEPVVFENHLTTKGFLCFNTKDKVKLKMYVSPNANADGSLINWDKVDTYITSKDTLYPKTNCSIFIRAYYDDNFSNTSDSVFRFDIEEFVQHVLLTMKDDESIRDIAIDLLSGIGKNSFKFDNGLEPAKNIKTLDDLDYSVISFIKEDPVHFKIDSVGFDKYKSPISGKVIFNKHYPSINYIKLK